MKPKDYLEQNNFLANEHGVYVYVDVKSQNHRVSLEDILQDFADEQLKEIKELKEVIQGLMERDLLGKKDLEQENTKLSNEIATIKLKLVEKASELTPIISEFHNYLREVSNCPIDCPLPKHLEKITEKAAMYDGLAK